MTFGSLPNIEIEWAYMKSLDELYVEEIIFNDLICITFVKEDEVMTMAYDKKQDSWSKVRWV